MSQRKDIPSPTLHKARITLATRKCREHELQQVADKAHKELADEQIKVQEAQSAVHRIEEDDRKQYGKEMGELIERQAPAYKKLRKVESRMHDEIISLRFKKAEGLPDSCECSAVKDKADTND